MNSIIEVIKNNKGIIKKVAIAGGLLVGGLIAKNIIKGAAYPENETYYETDVTEETCDGTEPANEE